MELAEAIRAAVATAPGARAALATILDRREQTGQLPSRITVDASAEAIAALRAVFSVRAVAALAPGRARIDLTRARRAAAVASGGLALDDVLYAVLGRVPRDPRAEAAVRAAALQRELAAVPAPDHPVSRAFLADEIAAAAAGTGDTWTLVAEGDVASAGGEVARAAAIVADVARALDAVLRLPGAIRLANFAARVLGDSKALAPGSERAKRLGAALLAYDPVTRAELADTQSISPAAAIAAALELRGLHRDDAGVLVQAFGPLVYARAGTGPFDHVARHAELGDPTPLSLAQLRDATLVELSVERITSFENQAPFLDYIERADPRRELVVLARGQASWAVVTLLRLCAARRSPMRHAGDLDRTGIQILRSLARRVHAPIEPWHMDVATHRRFASAAGRPIEPDERARIARLVAIDDPTAPCHPLLLELHRTGIWVEQ
ncbi:MAG TPA: DUF2399 domain-containing protein, partial [Kofleriaceae bacterium]|nr:DUF2399 domain-containing protein [Kofleriaceae bacterium]